MLLKKNQMKFDMPEPLSDILNITISDRMGLIYALQRISPTAMTQAYKEKGVSTGMPRLWCLEDYNKVTVYPRPDKDYENVRVEFLPPPKVL